MAVRPPRVICSALHPAYPPHLHAVHWIVPRLAPSWGSTSTCHLALDMRCLICGSCSSGRDFGRRHPSDSTSRWTPLPLACSSYYLVYSGLSPPGHCPCRAHRFGSASPTVATIPLLAGNCRHLNRNCSNGAVFAIRVSRRLQQKESRDTVPAFFCIGGAVEQSSQRAPNRPRRDANHLNTNSTRRLRWWSDSLRALGATGS